MKGALESLALVRAAEVEHGKSLRKAIKLIEQAAQWHSQGELDKARHAAADAGDYLMDRIGTADPVAPLEELLWQGDDDGHEAFLLARGS